MLFVIQSNIARDGFQRRDLGNIFENFAIAEKLKSNAYSNKFYQTFFWRNTAGQEIDYMEKWNQTADIYEFALSNQKKKKVPKVFMETNKNLEVNFKIITAENYQEFLIFG